MPFVKLDCGILNSTLWIDRPAREVFITALLMAEPIELMSPTAQLEVNTLNETGWTIPSGWYGFVSAASLGILSRAKVSPQAGLLALERLGSPEVESRTQAFEGRRLVRVDGGYVVLNFMKYRDRDYTGAERTRRYRERRRADEESHRDVTAVTEDVTPPRHVTRDVTQYRVQSTEADQDDVHTARARGQSLLTGTLPRDHVGCAWCGRVCVPGFLHAQFRRALGGPEDVADTRLRGWYMQTFAGVPDGEPVEPDALKFWRPRFANAFPAAAPHPAKPGRGTGRTGAAGADAYDQVMLGTAKEGRQ